MKHYDFGTQFERLYNRAAGQWAAGQQDPAAWFSADDRAWIAANGLVLQNFIDYAEDQANYGEPGLALAMAIELVRRDYFLNAQQGRPSGQVLDVERMPAKTDAVRGIEWLPRIIPKAKAKLRGELPPVLMYSCGGDRRFFKAHDIHPAEFLTLVWRNLDNDAAIVDWVVRRAGRG